MLNRLILIKMHEIDRACNRHKAIKKCKIKFQNVTSKRILNMITLCEVSIQKKAFANTVLQLS
jgi:hypothetical protein